jgi:hypothetical protein
MAMGESKAAQRKIATACRARVRKNAVIFA